MTVIYSKMQEYVQVIECIKSLMGSQ